MCSSGSGKVGVYACVAKNHTLDAREWCAAAADAIGGGKGGGKEKAANMVVLGGGGCGRGGRRGPGARRGRGCDITATATRRLASARPMA